MELRTHPVGSEHMNSYALICQTTRQSVLIDPGAEPDELDKLLVGSTPIGILVTHTHGDHIGELEFMRKHLQVPVYSGAAPHHNDVKIHTDRVLNAGDTFTVGDSTLRVYATPGHCVDMLCFEVIGTPTMIVGDTIFAGGPGRTSSAANLMITLHTLQHVVLKWPDATMCYPGHGPSFRLGEKRSLITAFATKKHGDAFGDLEW